MEGIYYYPLNFYKKEDNAMTRIYLVRHAEAEGNLYRRIQGWYNGLITENGYRQIRALEERFRDIHIDAVYSSDLFRTMTTAGAVYKPKQLPLFTDVALREVHMGWWEDRPWAEIRRTDPEEYAQFRVASPAWKVSGGESLDEVRQRVTTAVKKIALRHDGQTVAVFSHGTAIRNALTCLEGRPVEDCIKRPHGDNTAVSLLEFCGEQARIVFENDNSHLPREISTLYTQKWGKDGPRVADLWYRPLDFSSESELYLQARQEAWRTVHDSLEGFRGNAYLQEAKQLSREDPERVLCAMLDDRIVGILQLDPDQGAEQCVGVIPFYYILPKYRFQGLGVQLLGQAVSTYRPLGRDVLRLRCARENEAGQRFYHRHGFVKQGEAPGVFGKLDVLEKYIGYQA